VLSEAKLISTQVKLEFLRTGCQEAQDRCIALSFFLYDQQFVRVNQRSSVEYDNEKQLRKKLYCSAIGTVENLRYKNRRSLNRPET